MAECLYCGSNAEYVGLDTVENCSNPECRAYGSGINLIPTEPAPDIGEGIEECRDKLIAAMGVPPHYLMLQLYVAPRLEDEEDDG